MWLYVLFLLPVIIAVFAVKATASDATQRNIAYAFYVLPGVWFLMFGIGLLLKGPGLIETTAGEIAFMSLFALAPLSAILGIAFSVLLWKVTSLAILAVGAFVLFAMQMTLHDLGDATTLYRGSALLYAVLVFALELRWFIWMRPRFGNVDKTAA